MAICALAETKTTIFGEYLHSPKWPFTDFFADSLSNFEMLARLANICQRPFLRKT